MATPRPWARQLVRKSILAGVAAVLGLFLARTLSPSPFHTVENMNAPYFDGGLAWLNTEKPLRMADLRGKILLLDFWTFG